MYADRITGSMRRAIDETARRRRVQTRYNEQRGITPVGIQKAIRGVSERLKQVAEAVPAYKADEELPKKEVARLIKDLEKQMKEAARQLDFEQAALLRDQVYELRATLGDGGDPIAVKTKPVAAAADTNGAAAPAPRGRSTSRAVRVTGPRRRNRRRR